VQPSTPLGPDQVNVLLLLYDEMMIATYEEVRTAEMKLDALQKEDEIQVKPKPPAPCNRC
jgi:hypothetical protein